MMNRYIYEHCPFCWSPALKASGSSVAARPSVKLSGVAARPMPRVGDTSRAWRIDPRKYGG